MAKRQRTRKTKDKWFGVTYKENKESFVQSFKKLIENGVNGEALDSDFRKRREESLLSKKTLQRYIQMCDEVISSKDTTKAKELQDEILALVITHERKSGIIA